MSQVEKSLIHNIEKRGWQGRIISIKHLQDLQDEIRRLHKQGLLDEEFYQERLTQFNFGIPNTLPGTKSLIVIAIPRPQSQAIFNWKAESYVLPLPPTYVAYDEVRKQVEDLLVKTLEAKGYSASTARLPLKLLAVRSGLGSYGRNNICYVSGMGSFLQLVAAYSDLPCTKDTWKEAQMMRKCQDCEACHLKCPTGAIPSDRFLLRAERCIVFHNERKGNIPFPDWMSPSWHNCVVGCMYCQRVCPENKDFLQWIEGEEEFSEEETTLLLKAVPREQLPTTTVAKLERLDLIEYRDSLSRNLGVFFIK